MNSGGRRRGDGRYAALHEEESTEGDTLSPSAAVEAEAASAAAAAADYVVDLDDGNPLASVEVPQADQLQHVEDEDNALLDQPLPDADSLQLQMPSDHYSPPYEPPTPSPLAAEEEVEAAQDESPSALPVQHSKAPWKLDFYRVYFDVDDEIVKKRLLRSLNPLEVPLFDPDEVGKPDLCGPFWCTTTLVVVLAILGNLSTWMSSSDPASVDSISFTALSIAASVLFGFFLIVPAVVWFVLSRVHQVALKPTEIMSVYGYSLVVFIPTSLVATFHVEILRWIAMIAGCCLSVWVVLRHVLSRIEAESLLKKWTFLLLFLLPHVALVIYMKLEHFPSV